MTVETVNRAPHAQTERVNRDNWQIPWQNETLHTLKVTLAFGFCRAKESQRFDVLPHPFTKTHSFVSGEFLPNFLGNNGNIRKLVWSMTCWRFIWRNQSNSTSEKGHVKCVKRKCWNQKFCRETVLEYLSRKWDISEGCAQITGEVIKIFLALLARGNTQGKLLLSARLVLFSGALMWQISLQENYKLENLIWSAIWDIQILPLSACSPERTLCRAHFCRGGSPCFTCAPTRESSKIRECFEKQQVVHPANRLWRWISH